MRLTLPRLAAALMCATLPLSAKAAPRGMPLVSVDGAAATVDAFHAALKRGDTRAAAALLADDALVFEEGGVERTKAEYEAKHLPADAAFSQLVPSAVVRRSGGFEGAIAWVASEGRITGTYKGQAIDRLTTETMLLRRVGGRWKIVHIHWSSAARQND
jgi:ketosteroid isomerase-like protein